VINKLIPNEYLEDIYQIDMARLFKSGYRNLIMDIDNTIMPWNEYVITPKLVRWVNQTISMGFKICLLSNNNIQRAHSLADKLGIMAASNRGKPLPRAFISAINALQGTRRDTIVIGDQIFTDILGGNILGLYTILVDPISPNEFFGTKINRFMEKFIRRRIL
jgi:uncharacterized protein